MQTSYSSLPLAWLVLFKYSPWAGYSIHPYEVCWLTHPCFWQSTHTFLLSGTASQYNESVGSGTVYCRTYSHAHMDSSQYRKSTILSLQRILCISPSFVFVSWMQQQNTGIMTTTNSLLYNIYQTLAIENPTNLAHQSNLHGHNVTFCILLLSLLAYRLDLVRGRINSIPLQVFTALTIGLPTSYKAAGFKFTLQSSATVKQSTLRYSWISCHKLLDTVTASIWL